MNRAKKRCRDISSWQDDIRIWHIDRVPRMGPIDLTWDPFGDINSDDDFEEE